MSYNVITSSGSAGHRILGWIEYAALVIEILVVVIIIAAIFYAVGHYVNRAPILPEHEALYKQLKVPLG
jgi:hypothetical protein